MQIAGQSVPVVQVQEQREVIGGDAVRAESGDLRSDARAIKRAAQVTTAYLAPSEVAALRTRVELDQTVAVDLTAELGPWASYTAIVREQSATTITAATGDGTNLLHALTLAVREV